jgi:hypothetical protein
MGARRRAAHLCLAAADVAVVRLGVDCCLCWKPWLAKAAEGRIVLAVQERRGRASRVRSADGAAMFDAPGYRAVGRLMLGIRSPGVAVNLQARCCQSSAPRSLSVPAERRITRRGKTLSLSLLQPVAPERWSWIVPNSTKRASRFVVDDGLF